ADKHFTLPPTRFGAVSGYTPSPRRPIVPPARQRYLSEISDSVRGYHKHSAAKVTVARELPRLRGTQRMLEASGGRGASQARLLAERADKQDAVARKLIENWPAVKEAYSGDDFVTKVRDKEIRTKQVTVSLSGSRIRKVALPRYEDHGELLRWML